MNFFTLLIKYYVHTYIYIHTDMCTCKTSLNNHKSKENKLTTYTHKHILHCNLTIKNRTIVIKKIKNSLKN